MMQPDFLNDLNESQRKAVEYVDGPSLVIAGAGSGKTRVLTYKIAYLLQSGARPWEILALTFTNKAANEMKERIAALVGIDKARGLWMGTFHSIFNRILHHEADKLGYDASYSIYQPGDAQSLIKTILREKGLDDKVYKPAAVLGRISEAKNALVLPEDYAQSKNFTSYDVKASIPKMGMIYHTYAERMHQANAMDFDDLLLNTFLLFQRFPDVRAKYAAHFQWVLVDEYQDTNYVQHQILSQLCAEKKNICVVGDDAQSIYGFRGAKIENILNFETTYNAELFKLERNYRSTRNIVGAANSLISNNLHQIKKEVFSENEVGDCLQVSLAYSDVEEGEKVVNRIIRLYAQEHLEYKDIAILYRTNAQSRIFEESLLNHHIPYRIYGGQSFYDHKEIRDVLAYFRLVVNPSDEEAFKRILNVPARGLGNVTRDKILALVSQNHLSAWSVLEHPVEAGLAVNKGTLAKLNDFRQKMFDFMSCRDSVDAYTLGHRIIMETGLWAEAIRQNHTDGKETKELLEELLNGLNTFVEMRRESGEESFVTLKDYLNEVSLLSDHEMNERKNADNVNVVTLMTVHAAKGLEFSAVFIVGLEKDLFPNALASIYEKEMEEERRLFYVALTRAKKYCYLSWAKSRFRYGTYDFCEPSQFLQEIDARYLRFEAGYLRRFSGSSKRNGLERTYRGNSADDSLRTKPLNEVSKPRSSVPQPLFGGEAKREAVRKDSVNYNGQVLRVGQRVAHLRFGEGVVSALELDADDAKATIEFDNEGKKNLLLKYAKLTII